MDYNPLNKIIYGSIQKERKEGWKEGKGRKEGRAEGKKGREGREKGRRKEGKKDAFSLWYYVIY